MPALVVRLSHSRFLRANQALQIRPIPVVNLGASASHTWESVRRPKPLKPQRQSIAVRVILRAPRQMPPALCATCAPPHAPRWADASLARQRGDDTAVGRIGQRPQRPIDVRFPSPIGSRNQIQRSKWDHQIWERQIIRYRPGLSASIPALASPPPPQKSHQVQARDNDEEPRHDIRNRRDCLRYPVRQIP